MGPGSFDHLREELRPRPDGFGRVRAEHVASKSGADASPHLPCGDRALSQWSAAADRGVGQAATLLRDTTDDAPPAPHRNPEHGRPVAFAAGRVPVALPPATAAARSRGVAARYRPPQQQRPIKKPEIGVTGTS